MLRQPLLVVSSCGTSLLTHGSSPKVRQLLSASANSTEAELSPDQRAGIEQRLAAARDALVAAPDQEARRMSAELNALLSLLDRVRGDSPRGADVHVLVGTDTYQGRITTELLRQEVERRWQGSTATVQVFPGLTTSDPLGFAAAMGDVAVWCHERLAGASAGDHRVVFSLTGGFKSMQAFLTVLGMIYGDELLYVFESAGSPLLSIPRLPIELGAAAVLRPHLQHVRRLRALGQVNEEEVADLPELLITVLDGHAALSPWAEMLLRSAERELYGKDLLPSPAPDRLCFSRGFRKDASHLAPARLVILNQRIDALAKALIDGHHLASVSLKPLAGKPRPPSTHEFYAWSDEDARRCFCHYKEGQLVVDSLGKHL